MFQGELMVCSACGFEQRSDPTFESGWTCVAVDTQMEYFCPDCWPTQSKYCITCEKYYEDIYQGCPWCQRDAEVGPPAADGE